MTADSAFHLATRILRSMHLTDLALREDMPVGHPRLQAIKTTMLGKIFESEGREVDDCTLPLVLAAVPRAQTPSLLGAQEVRAFAEFLRRQFAT